MFKNNKFIKIITCILVLSVTLFSGTIIGYLVHKNNVNDALIKLDNVKEILKDEWYFSDQFIDIDKELIDNAIYGMASNTIDIHTSYMNQEEVKNFTEGTNHHFVGIGIQYSAVDTNKIVTNVFENSPAKKAGMKAGDFIQKVDGIDVTSFDAEEIKELILGEVNSKVVIDIKRDNQIIQLEIYRGEIGSVFGEIVDNVGYIQILSFGDDTAYQLEQLLNGFIEKDIDSYIIDLRDNGGGYLNSLIDICGLFIPKGNVAMHQVFSDDSIKTFKTDREPIDGINEVVILINQNSASASEVFTLAMRENFTNTTVVGVESYGKGTVQQTRTFSDGSALKFTTGRWQSSQGEVLIEKGIIPDVIVDSKNIVNDPIYDFLDKKYLYKDVEYFMIGVQDTLKFLGYEINDQKGHFSDDTLKALNTFQETYKLEKTDYVDKNIYLNIKAKMLNVYANDHYKDDYFIKAMEIINE